MGLLRKGQPSKKTPNLSDLMIMIALAGVSLVLYRGLTTAFQAQLDAPIRMKWTLKYYWLSAIAFPAIGAMTVAVPLLKLRRSRHRRDFRQPGVVACVAASLCLIPLATWVFLIRLSPSPPNFASWPLLICRELWERVGYAVAGAWLTFVVIGNSDRETDWIDRLGIALGLAWLLAPAWTILNQMPWF